MSVPCNTRDRESGESFLLLGKSSGETKGNNFFYSTSNETVLFTSSGHSYGHDRRLLGLDKFMEKFLSSY